MRLTKKQKTIRKQEALQYLRLLLKPGDTVWTILRHVSKSGMSRRIDLCVMRDNEPRLITRSVADVLGCRHDMDKQGLTVGGCGMDMGFHMVYNLSRSLWPTGFGCIGTGCPANDHVNGDYTAHKDAQNKQSIQARKRGHVGPDPSTMPGHIHLDGGYALQQRWL